MNSNSNLSSSSSVGESSVSSGERSVVRFGSVQVREYERQLADSPEIGPDYASLAIGWRYTAHDVVSIEEFKDQPHDDDDNEMIPTRRHNHHHLRRQGGRLSGRGETKDVHKFKAMERLNLLDSYCCNPTASPTQPASFRARTQ